MPHFSLPYLSFNTFAPCVAPEVFSQSPDFRTSWVILTQHKLDLHNIITLSFLSFFIKKTPMSVDPTKAQALVDWSDPTTWKQF